MIIARAPLRIPLGGGGTDLPSYYSLYGGKWISAAINKYIYIILNKRFEHTLRISYSQTEEVSTPEEVQHPIVKEALRMLNIDGGIEIVSIADIPSQTGMGTSGSFTVALLTALYGYLRNKIQKDLPSRQQIAEEACHIAMDILKEPSGKQDEYIAAFGGITAFEVNQKGEVKVTPLYPLQFSDINLRELENNLLMFYTGIRRESREALKIQKQATQQNDREIIENLHRIKEIGQEIHKSLIKGDFKRFGELMDEHWQEKSKRKGTVNEKIMHWYQVAKEAGAVGGKLMGAGGGGFFLFYCEDVNKPKLRAAMQIEGLREETFRFDLEGVKIIGDFS
jgi:D-glycero-alpha-D-manno-heptose-7-phosphate kinase